MGMSVAYKRRRADAGWSECFVLNCPGRSATDQKRDYLPMFPAASFRLQTVLQFKTVIFFSAFLLAVSFASASFALSKAARYLIDQEIAEGCDGRSGTFGADGIFEVDLTGDGKKDLVLAHQAITCDGGLAMSLYCGMQVCSIKVYHRKGALLVLHEEFLGRILDFTPSPKPAFTVMSHGGATTKWRP